MANKGEFLEKAMMYERAEMFENMAEEMKRFVTASDADLNDNERKMLSNAYKSVIGKKRSAWRKIMSIEQNLDEDNTKRPLVKKYLNEIVKDLNNKCEELLTLLNNHLIPNAMCPESKVFFLKMKGDHLRYLVEVSPEKDDLKEKSKKAYIEATDIGDLNLGCAHAFRLGLALNFSVFEYEIENSRSIAYQMAKKAFDDAGPEIVHLGEGELEDTMTMMQLLGDNLTFWNDDQ